MMENISRRDWLRMGTVACAGTLAVARPAAAQQSYLDAARCMEAMIGAPLAASWEEPVAGLVGIIVDSSRTLRELELGEIEPATRFALR